MSFSPMDCGILQKILLYILNYIMPATNWLLLSSQSKSSGLRNIVDHLFQKIQTQPRIAYEVDEDIVIAGLVSKGFGVAVVPYMADLLRMDVKIIQISHPSWERNFYMASLKAHHFTPAVKNFHDHVLIQVDNLHQPLVNLSHSSISTD